MSQNPPKVLAISEDETIVWLRRAEGDEEQEVRECARCYLGESGGEYHVMESAMRPWTAEEDCEGLTHDEDDRESGDCICGYYLDEGYQLGCADDHPAAVLAWKVEWVG